jgi:hypothetical protein
LTTANWLTLLGTLVAVAGTWGGLLVRVKVAEGRVTTLERGREKQGERIGVIEERTAAIEGSLAQLGQPPPRNQARSRTRGVPIQVPVYQAEDEEPST